MEAPAVLKASPPVPADWHGLTAVLAEAILPPQRLETIREKTAFLDGANAQRATAAMAVEKLVQIIDAAAKGANAGIEYDAGFLDALTFCRKIITGGTA